ncbi:uncharacterized protein LOC130628889 [Hydractinia symbiolongicarpus]|uniref:uncharacterized protein LOC130628889 n=1 Tax=Hydractinia symbiolongicarpus TaxID=13093 RepID=UPI00254E3E43|nr:uncharacterized protein LOC130628889 [Hydractinia symbiolongicarpus]
MGPKEAHSINRTSCVAWFFVLCGAVLITTATANPYWRGRTEQHEGIFQRCIKDKCNSIKVFSGEDKELDVIRIMLVIGLGYIVLAMFLGILSVASSAYVAVLKCLAVIHITISLSIYTFAFVNGSMTLLWCFYTAWGGVGLYFIGLVLLSSKILLSRQTKEEDSGIIENLYAQ